MEALILAGGKAERLGDAAAGQPEAPRPVAGHPIAAVSRSPGSPAPG